MRLVKVLLLASVGFGFVGACAPFATADTVHVVAPAATETSLAPIAPGVAVVTDWDVPVFWVDNVFWFWDGGVWYRSPTFEGERALVRDLPAALAQVHEPWAYVDYRAREELRRPMPEGEHHAAAPSSRMAMRRR